MWTDHIFTSTENQNKCWLPLNSITDKLWYVNDTTQNMRVIVGAFTEHPIAWKVSKCENSTYPGIQMLTLAQDIYDPHKDYIERDGNEKIIGMWADYWDTTNEPNIEPIDPSIPVMKPTIIGKIKASTPSIKVGGSYKTLTVQLFDSSDNDITDQFSDADFIWTCSVINKDKTAVPFDGETWRKGTTFNQKKIKFPNDRSYLDKVLEIKCTIIHKDIGLEVTEQFDLII